MPFLGLWDVRWYVRASEKLERKEDGKEQHDDISEREEYNLIIAVDFDGILCKNRFPEIGEPQYENISLVRQLIDKGYEVILWTSRVDAELDAAVKWCEDYGLHFCAVNDQAPSNKEQYSAKYPNGTRKVYADLYVDDHNLEYVLEKNMGGYWAQKYLKGVLNNEYTTKR